MERLLDFGLANAIAVAILAPLAWVLARVIKRPAWSHAIWLIVLLKFVTPPLLQAPIVPAVETEKPREVAPPSFEILVEPVATLPADVLAMPTIVSEPASVPEAPRWVLPDWPTVLVLSWAGGSVAWVLLAAWRVARFSRVVRQAEAAPEEITAWVERLAEQIGLRRVPIVAMVKSRVSPMVWTLGGRARLIVPEALWKRLDDDQRAAMLVHELAHLKRGDPWVRLLELAATSLFWWHPALWVSRRELHRAEEACCDLWVVWALPKSRKRYASALVEAVDYLSESRPKTLPIGASGMGQVEDLSRRIGMIMRSDAPKGLSRTGMLAVVGLGLALLPWRATRAQQEPSKPEEAKPVGEVVKSYIKRFTGDPAEIKPLGDAVVQQNENAKIPDPEAAEAAIVEAFCMNPEVSELRDQIQRLEQRLERTKSMVRDQVSDPSIKHLRDQIANVKAEYEALWERLYPELKARISESASMRRFLQMELDRAKERLQWSEQMRSKGLLGADVVHADKERVERAKAQIDAESRERPSTPESAAMLKLEMEKARERLEWAEQMREKKYISSSELSDAKAGVERARIHIETEQRAREEAVRKAEHEVKLFEAQLGIRKALLAKAQAQRGLAQTELARLLNLGKQGANFVSNGEMQRAQAEMGVADAMVAEAQAGVVEGEVMLEYAVKQSQALAKITEPGEQINKAQDAFRNAQSGVRENPLAPQSNGSARDPNQRIDELESKLDTILKEIEALRKERAGDSPRR